MTNVTGTLDLDFVLVDNEGLWVDTISPSSEQLAAGETIQMLGTWDNDQPVTLTLTLSTASSFNGNPLNKTNGNFTPYSLSDLVDALIDHILMRKIIPVNDRPTADLNKDNLLNVGDVLKAVEESNK
jgi:hypothetical protein